MENNELGRFAPEGEVGWQGQSKSDEAAAKRRIQEVELRELIADDHNRKRGVIEKISGQNKVDEVDVAYAEAVEVNKNFDKEKLQEGRRQILVEALNQALSKDDGLSRAEIDKILTKHAEEAGGLENAREIMDGILVSENISVSYPWPTRIPRYYPKDGSFK